MKRIAILGVLILILMASLLVGCTDKKLTQEDMEQLVADVLVANAEVDTVKFNINTTTAMEMVGGTQPGEASMTGDGSGAIDSANREMQMIMNMNIDIPGEGTQTMPMESYLVDGWMHIKISTQETGAQWMKMKLPEGMWGSQSQLDQQIELLQTADEVNLLGSENVNGIDCYVVEVVPSMEAIKEVLSEFQMPGLEGIDSLEIDLANLIKEMSFKQWIVEDGYLIMKSATHVQMEIYPGDLTATAKEFQKISVNQDTEMIFYDYNEPVSIELPAGALEN